MGEPARLGPALRELLEEPCHSLCYGVASLWELVIKAGLGREGFQVQPSLLRCTLLHRDPFDPCCWPRRSGKSFC
jgi:PIN domain nuclease of toxin-antitoxin system